MKIIITENQNYVLRRLQQFIEIVEDKIEGSEQNDDNPWWCMAYYNPDSFFDYIRYNSVNEFIMQNWDFFNDISEKGGTDASILLFEDTLNKIVEENYGNYIRNLWVRKCGISRF